LLKSIGWGEAMNEPERHCLTIFGEALECASPQERAAYLDRACGQDSTLRARVEELLQAHRAAGGFLQGNASGTFPESLAPDGVSTAPEAARERPGAVIGPYKLLEQIGEGGFGIVFLAEQTQPLRRKVALKVLKPGMDTRQVVARFEAERQALALMDHPNIATVLDGGETATGRPYFVMELVRGVPITRYCDQHKLTVRQRLELFACVCQAVQHAHQKGIIHRDLKPSNVLVAAHDGVPMVKVIDFGIAKATGQALTDKTLFTHFAQMVGTPLYMSPEQAGRSGLDVDTRSDIYSLGVMLYELLTGTTPLDKERLKKVGYEELRRMICEEEPPRPSTRLSTLGEAAPTVSANRQIDPKRLSRLCRGELDWVVMKALEKDRNRRYESASAFAADVERHLRDEPVAACPPSRWYRFHKFARRHKVTLTVAALVVVVLGLATSISAWQAIRATRAEGLAGERLAVSEERRQQVTLEKTEKEKALVRVLQEKGRADQNLAQARKAVKDYLTKTARNRLLKEADFHPLRRELLESAIPFYQEFVKQQQGDPELEAERGRAFGDLAVLREDLGQLDQALAAYEQRLAIFERLAADFPAKPAYRQEVAQTYRNIGNVYLWKKQPAKAEPAYRQGLTLLEALRVKYPAFPPYRQGLAGVCNNLGYLLRNQGRLDEALPLQQKAVDLFERLVADFPRVSEYRQALAESHSNLGVLFNVLRRHDDALTSIQRGEDLLRKLADEFPTAPEHREGWAGTLNNKSVLLRALGQRKEGLAALKQALGIQEQLAADFASVPGYRLAVARGQVNLSAALLELNRHTEALAACDKAVDILDRLARQGPPAFPAYRHALALAHNNRGEVLRRLVRNEEAIDALKKALGIQEKLVADFRSILRFRRDLGMGYCNLGELLMILGRYNQASDAYARGLPIREKLAHDFPADKSYAVDLAGCYGGIGSVVRMRGQPEAALDWYAKALSRLKPVLAESPRLAEARRFACIVHMARALALDQLARPAEALKDWDRALALDDGERQEAIRLARAATQARADKARKKP
jgi:serine/threonine protein kinase